MCVALRLGCKRVYIVSCLIRTEQSNEIGEKMHLAETLPGAFP